MGMNKYCTQLTFIFTQFVAKITAILVPNPSREVITHGCKF